MFIYQWLVWKDVQQLNHLFHSHKTGHARLNQSIGWVVRSRGSELKQNSKWLPAERTLGVHANTLGSAHWFSHHVRTIQQHRILSQSLPISFRPGEHCRSPSAHLPVSGFIPPKDRDRKGEVGEEMSEQAMDNSVFGGYRREGLADLSQAKASRGGLEAEGLPKRDTVVWMIEWGTMPTHSLRSHLSMKTQNLLSI